MTQQHRNKCDCTLHGHSKSRANWIPDGDWGTEKESKWTKTLRVYIMTHNVKKKKQQ